MKIKRSLSLLVLLVVSSQPAVLAQTQGPETGSAEAAHKELEKKAVVLLEEAVADARQLKHVESGVHAEVVAAGLLWPRDEQSARALFKEAADGVSALGAQVDPEDPQFYNAAQSASQLRVELVQAAARFDPKLALDYLRSTRPQHPEAFQAAGYNQLSQEQALEMSLAGQIAAQDPKKALAMAEESLSRGPTTALASVLNQLRAKDPASASKLAADIVTKLVGVDISNDSEASGLASQLLSMTRPADPSTTQQVSIMVEEPMDSATPDRAQAVQLIDQQTRAQLIEKVLASVAKATNDVPNQGGVYYLYSALQTLMPELEKTMPSRVPALRQRMETIERSINPQAQLWKPYQELMQTGTADALLEAASKAPAEVRDQLYTQAAWKAFNDGNDPERARQIVDSMPNPQQRAQMRRNIDQQVQWHAAQKGDYDAARQAALRLPTVEEKVSALLQVAGAAAAKGDKQAARSTLEEALGLLGDQPHNYQQFAAELQVASAEAQFDAEGSFTIIETSIERLNDLLDSAASLDGFGQDGFTDGELNVQSGYIWNQMINQCTSALGALAPSDFDRASADAKKFRRADSRAVAELLLAQTLLEGVNARRSLQGRRSSGGIVIIGKR